VVMLVAFLARDENACAVCFSPADPDIS
jgi:hypothetical protein